MSAPRITLPLLASAHPFLRLRRALKAAFAAALSDPQLGDALAGLRHGDDTWEESEDRMGWRLLPESGEGFAFLGTYLGPESVHREAPDLYFFLELPRGSVEQEAADERADEITRAITTLNRLGLKVYWGHTPGGTNGLWAVMSTLDALRSGDAEAAIGQFVGHALTSARSSGLMALYLGPSYAPGSTGGGASPPGGDGEPARAPAAGEGGS